MVSVGPCDKWRLQSRDNDVTLRVIAAAAAVAAAAAAGPFLSVLSSASSDVTSGDLCSSDVMC